MEEPRRWWRDWYGLPPGLQRSRARMHERLRSPLAGRALWWERFILALAVVGLALWWWTSGPHLVFLGIAVFRFAVMSPDNRRRVFGLPQR